MPTPFCFQELDAELADLEDVKDAVGCPVEMNPGQKYWKQIQSLCNHHH